MPTEPRNPALSLVGFGTLFLLAWRFLPLPWPVSMPLLSVATGALSGCVGLLCQRARHWRRLTVLGVALFAGGLVLFEVSSQSAESLPVAFGLVIAVSSILSRCPRWAIVLATVLAVMVDFAQLHDDRPAPILVAALLAMLLAPRPWFATALGAVALICDVFVRESETFQFMITAGVDQFTVVTPLRIIGTALLTSGVFSLLPAWKPLQAVGQHGLTLNLAAAVVATWFGSTSATFTWTSTLRGLGMAPPQVFDPLGAYSLLLHGWQHWWLAALAGVCCAALCFRQGWGPLEKPFTSQ